jgi:hypothetical protein
MPKLSLKKVFEAAAADPKRKFFALEMFEEGGDLGPAMGAGEVEVPEAMSTDDQLREAFKSLILSVLDDTSLSLEEMGDKIVALLTVQEEADEALSGGSSGGSGDGSGSGSGSESAGGDSDKKEKPAAESLAQQGAGAGSGSGSGSASAAQRSPPRIRRPAQRSPRRSNPSHPNRPRIDGSPSVERETPGVRRGNGSESHGYGWRHGEQQPRRSTGSSGLSNGPALGGSAGNGDGG